MPSSEERREYTVGRGSRHRAAGRNRRLVFFGLASVWGFVVGVAGFLASMALAGQPIQPPGTAMAGLVPALAVALFGGAVIAGAYQEAKRNSRR